MDKASQRHRLRGKRTQGKGIAVVAPRSNPFLAKWLCRASRGIEGQSRWRCDAFAPKPVALQCLALIPWTRWFISISTAKTPRAPRK
jgi:hypothetical protein